MNSTSTPYLANDKVLRKSDENGFSENEKMQEDLLQQMRQVCSCLNLISYLNTFFWPLKHSVATAAHMRPMKFEFFYFLNIYTTFE